MIVELGHFALILALGVALLQMAVPFVGARNGWRNWMEMAAPAATASARRRPASSAVRPTVASKSRVPAISSSSSAPFSKLSATAPASVATRSSAGVRSRLVIPASRSNGNRPLPQARQTLLFSATMPPSIAELAGSMLRNPVRVEVAPPSTTVERVRQTMMFVDEADKKAAQDAAPNPLTGEPTPDQADAPVPGPTGTTPKEK